MIDHVKHQVINYVLSSLWLSFLQSVTQKIISIMFNFYINKIIFNFLCSYNEHDEMKEEKKSIDDLGELVHEFNNTCYYWHTIQYF